MASSPHQPGWPPNHHQSQDVGSSSSFQCPQCPRNFKRVEHLKRHERGHENTRRFTCSTCGKRFARSDVLTRHVLIHNPAREVVMPPEVGMPTTQRRACTPCSKAREKCNKGNPCSRCHARSISCVYPIPRIQPIRANQREYHEGLSDPSGISPDSAKSMSPQTQTASASENTMFSTNLSSKRLVPGLASHIVAPHESLQQSQPPEDAMIESSNVVSLHQPLDIPYGSMEINEFQHSEPMRQATQLFTPGPSAQTAQTATPGFLGLDVPSFSYQATGYDTDLDLHINWLPTNDTIDLDYRSILDLTMSGNGLESDAALPIVPMESQAFPSSAAIRNLTTARSPAECHFLTQPQSTTSPSGTSSSISWTGTDSRVGNPGEGELYATSKNGARNPCTVRSKVPQILIPGTHPQFSSHELHSEQAPSPPLGFPDLEHLATSPSLTADQQDLLIWKSTYEDISHHFRRLCLDCDGFYPSYITHNFPSMQHFDIFIRLFLASFNPIVPMIHQTLTTVNDFWILTLAMAAVGSQYTRTQEFDAMVIPMHEFLRRALQTEVERQGNSDQPIALFQSILISHIGMLYYGSTRLSSYAMSRCGGLVGLAESFQLLESTSSSDESILHIKDKIRNASLNTLHEQWQNWARLETKRRLGYLAWLLDCMSQYHHVDFQSPFSLEVPTGDLPHDGLWNTNSAHEWAELFQRTNRNPSLQPALRKLFLERQVKSDLGESSRIILLHGVYHEIELVKSYFQRPLSSWIPSAQQVPRTSLASGGHLQEAQEPSEKWLNELPTFAAWRNAALDCVDVLHWAANGTIALLSGAEHPTVFHLHFSRVILLVPHREILALVLFTVGSAATHSRIPGREEARAAEQEILRWAQRDESKARLSAVHCGCLYWHIRRYSTMAFYEPSSVFLATLSLWAYSYYASRASPIIQRERHDHEYDRSGSPSRQSSPFANVSGTAASAPGPESGVGESRDLNSRGSSHVPDSEPTFIRLDRPNDDEMVQHFVRCGRPSNMRAYITGVGDICVAKGPTRILREGSKILGAASLAWGRTRDYAAILKALEKTMSGAKLCEESFGG
ncbi:hypothetical protein EDB81DRAFT_802815 [Dactylonectria macrodidyma]|uniref:Uncharacterized protein n=1 Tax=Dactylonectria macrodidyma TaxID=307937 RepID=A0A9P9EFF2_9HYPO|nr:hypothetical protein EDB81DRAFT_802815 [Dactylonectria macrodidyma]